MRHFYDAKEVQRLLELNSLRTSQARIQSMNEELKSHGYWTERGKIPKQYFHEKYPYIPEAPHEWLSERTMSLS